MLPLSTRKFGLWPGMCCNDRPSHPYPAQGIITLAAWTLGNLGRAGYGATNEGLWPYTYDTCDRGTFPWQRSPDGSPGPEVLIQPNGRNLSSLPGQRLSACTCPNSDHPGPRHNVGRGAPEVDMLEAEIDRTRSVGRSSQSLQVAPYNANYEVVRTEPATRIYNPNITHINEYTGGPWQQAVSALSEIDDRYYVESGGEFTTYGYELWSDPTKREDGYITFYNMGVPSWTVTAATVGADPVTGIGPRLIPEEPMVSPHLPTISVGTMSSDCSISIT